MYVDSATYARQTPKLVTGRPKAVTDLQMLQIGPYVFSLRYPRNDIYSKELDDHFSINERLPVTKTMMSFQLGGFAAQFEELGAAGEGVNGEVAIKMEMHTGQLLAIKNLATSNAQQKQIAEPEVNFMKLLSHVSPRG